MAVRTMRREATSHATALRMYQSLTALRQWRPTFGERRTDVGQICKTFRKLGPDDATSDQAWTDINFTLTNLGRFCDRLHPRATLLSASDEVCTHIFSIRRQKGRRGADASPSGQTDKSSPQVVRAIGLRWRVCKTMRTFSATFHVHQMNSMEHPNHMRTFPRPSLPSDSSPNTRSLHDAH